MYEYNATLVRVIDGDTLEVDIDLGFKTTLKKEKVRLLGIDTPELRSSNSTERIHAKAAKEFVQSLMKPGSELLINTKKDKKGKYGRYLAHVRFKNIDGNFECDLVKFLIENGYEKKSSYKEEQK